MNTEDTVIISGCGPAGAILALSLAKQNIPILLFEKEASLPIDLRASTFHPPSLDMIADLDNVVIEKMLAKGLIVDRYQYRDRRTKEVASFDMSLLAGETRHPFRLQLEQYELTIIIMEELRKYPGVSIFLEHEVLDFTQTEDYISVRVKSPGGVQIFDGCYLVGAEGARSNTRKCSGIGYDGFTYDEKFLVVSTSFPFEDVFDDFSYVNYISDPDEWCVVLRTDKIWRVLFPTTPKTEDDEVQFLSEEFVQERLHHLYDKIGDYPIEYRMLYSVNQRVAESYHCGRMVLVGDACHINNPLGGMGMNGGLHDAFNLAPRIERILKKNSNYQQEFAHYDRQRRILAVRFVQEHTINNKKLMESIDPDVQAKRQKYFMETAADPIKAKRFLMERAMLDCVAESLAEK